MSKRWCKGCIFGHADYNEHDQWIVFKKDESGREWYAIYGDDFLNKGYRSFLSIKQ